MSSAQKDIVYIDIDDEITGIIDKVQNAKTGIVALVLPKRAAVLQSVVNMKLLKRSSEEAKKNIVLITSESSLMPLAGAAGIHVAKTLQTKPAIPTAPKIYDSTVSVDEDETAPVASEPDKKIDASKPIGVLAGLTKPARDEEETIEVDNTDDSSAAEIQEPVKKPKNKKLKIPDFNKFRTRLLLGGTALVLLLIFWYMAAFVMPKATIVLKTTTSELTGEVAFTTSPELQELDTEGRVVPSVVEVLKKTDSEKVAATGEKDNGTKATGTMTFTNCTDDTVTIPAGTGVSNGSLTYITQGTVRLDEGEFNSGAVCKSTGDHVESVKVVSQENGDKYNADARSYSVAGAGNSVKAQGSAMTGGTSQIVKVVSQKDVDDARKKIEDRTESELTEEMLTTLEQKGYYGLRESLIVGSPEFTSTPAVGEPGDEVTVTSNITYTMTAVKSDDLKTLIRESVKEEVNPSTQMVQSTGLEKAVIRVTEKQPDGRVTANLQSSVVIGPQLDLEKLKQDIAGKKRGATQDMLKDLPGVEDVVVDYSPFWVYSTPNKTSKISITLEQANPSNETE